MKTGWLWRELVAELGLDRQGRLRKSAEARYREAAAKGIVTEKRMGNRKRYLGVARSLGMSFDE